jgi:hypothetical protein
MIFVHGLLYGLLLNKSFLHYLGCLSSLLLPVFSVELRALTHHLKASVHDFESPNLIEKNKAQIEGNVEEHAENHEPTLHIL